MSADSSSSSQTEETAAVREHWSKAQSWTLTAVKRGAGPDGAHLGVFVDADAPRVIRLLDPSGARHLLPATGVRPQPSPAAAAGIAGSQAALWSRAGLSPLTTSSSRPVRRLASWRGALPAAAAACSVGRDPHQKDPETVRGHSSTVRKASRRISKHWTVHILQLRSDPISDGWPPLCLILPSPLTLNPGFSFFVR